MSEILFISHRIPFPPDRGDKIRSHHVLRHLAAIAPVHVATFADDEHDGIAEAELTRVATTYRVVNRTKSLALAGVEAMLVGKPASVTAFRSKALQAYVRETLRQREIGLIYIFSGQMGQYVPADFTGRVVVDFVDVDSAKFDAYAAAHGGIRARVEKREAARLRAEELRVAKRASVSMFISDEEAALFRSRLPTNERSRIPVRTLTNGIDSTTFDPAAVAPDPEMAALPYPRVVFTGQMDYAPNVVACLRVAHEILPAIRQTFPEASFHIVGRNPGERLKGLSGRDGIHVLGRVPDTRPYLAAADLALVPLSIARGVQNKVLEAMSMGRPTVLTPEAATGIAARTGAEFIVADGDAAIIDACVSLFSDRERAREIGEAARRFVVSNASWEEALAELPEIVGFNGRTARDAA